MQVISTFGLWVCWLRDSEVSSLSSSRDVSGNPKEGRTTSSFQQDVDFLLGIKNPDGNRPICSLQKSLISRDLGDIYMGFQNAGRTLSPKIKKILFIGILQHSELHVMLK